MNQVILVTWWCGFIWSNFLQKFVRQYPEVDFINLDSLTYAGSLDNCSWLEQSSNYKFIRCDINNINGLEQIYKECKITDCIHFAAESHVDNSIVDPSIFLQTNIIGTNNLLLLHKKYNCNRFHFISTDEVYGDLPLDRTDLLFTEDTPLHPHSPYSTSKASADMLVQAFHRTYWVNTSTSRCSNNYGPRQHKEKLIPHFIHKLLQNQKVPLYGDGLNIRDWIHVDDHNEGVWSIFTKWENWCIYNLGGNNEVSNKELTYLLLQAFQKDESSIQFVADRKWHDRRYAIDCSKAKTELLWSPQISFEEGLKQSIERYKAQL